jgi:flavin reductase
MGMDAISSPVSSQAFRDAMARLAMSVHLVTTDGPAGRGGATVTALCSVTDSPPTLLICLGRDSRTNQLIQENRVLAVNTLRTSQAALSGIFASGNRRTMDERFAEARWTSLATGAPALADGLVTFDCRVTDIDEVGTHSVIFAEIAALAMPPAGEVLIHVNRGYRRDPV